MNDQNKKSYSTFYCLHLLMVLLFYFLFIVLFCNQLTNRKKGNVQGFDYYTSPFTQKDITAQDTSVTNRICAEKHTLRKKDEKNKQQLNNNKITKFVYCH